MGQVVIGGVTFEIYGEHAADAGGVQCAVKYFAGVLHGADFLAASADAQKQALVAASRMLDRQTWQGLPVAAVPSPQPLQWPRTGVVDKYGQAVSSASIPVNVIQGAYELADAILGDASVQTNTSTGSNVKREALRVGRISLEEEKFRSDVGTAGRFPTIIQELLGQYLGGGAAAAEAFSFGLADSFWDDDAPNSGGPFTFSGGSL